MFGILGLKSPFEVITPIFIIFFFNKVVVPHISGFSFVFPCFCRHFVPACGCVGLVHRFIFRLLLVAFICVLAIQTGKACPIKDNNSNNDRQYIVL